MTKQFHVILIDAKEYFEYYPGICRAYVHPKEHRRLSRHYQTICDNFDTEFVWGEVRDVLPQNKIVKVKEMAKDDVTPITYDYLIVTSGSQYGINMVHPLRASKGTECLWYPSFLEETIAQSAWKGLDERFLSGRRKHLTEEYETLKGFHDSNSTIWVLGAGFVGIEFATEVKHYFPNIEVVVIEQRDEPVGIMPKQCVDYCQKYMDKHGIKTVYGGSYKKFLSPTDSEEDQIKNVCNSLPQLAKEWNSQVPARLYMAVGLRAINQFMPKSAVTPGARGGWITCNKHQQVLSEGKPLEGIYAAGNCCEVEGIRLPKNSFPGEDMASVACHNVLIEEAKKQPGGCVSFLKSKKFKETHWGWGTGLCATSLGPHDATLVAFSTDKPKSGRQVLTGILAAWNKEFIRWSKVDQISGGCIGTLVWKLVH